MATYYALALRGSLNRNVIWSDLQPLVERDIITRGYTPSWLMGGHSDWESELQGIVESYPPQFKDYALKLVDVVRTMYLKDPSTVVVVETLKPAALEQMIHEGTFNNRLDGAFKGIEHSFFEYGKANRRVRQKPNRFSLLLRYLIPLWV